MPSSSGTLTSAIGFTLTRVIVPLWVLAGAAFKLYERTPSNLPSVILKTAKDMHLDLDMLLRLLIGLEFFAAGLMFFVPRLARLMAIFMLSCFCLILLGEMYRQATKCGCFGSITIKPWQMLIIDASLLLGVILFRPGRREPMQPLRRRSLAGSALSAVVIAAIGLGLAFAVPQRPATSQEDVTPPASADQGGDISNGAAPPPADPQINPAPAPVPNSWYIRTTTQQEWVGKNWRDIDIFQFMRRWPKDLDQGKHYVVFYSRTCEHCEQMFYDYFSTPLDAPVAAVQIPNSRTVMTAEGAWAMPPAAVELLELPLGCNWIITPPLALTIQDGKITCAVEGEGFDQCFRP